MYPNAKWLAFIINKKLHWLYRKKKQKNNNWKAPDRIILCKIKLQGKPSLQVIQVYAPTRDHDDETVMFYEELEKAVDKKAWSHQIVMGDLSQNWSKKYKRKHEMRAFGTGSRNERG